MNNNKEKEEEGGERGGRGGGGGGEVYLLGTPLPVSKENDKEKFIPLWKQEARDELGRKRFHGAFTGGFQAGYHNTVGSREGWAPSTFKSSRTDRNSKEKYNNVEDFMDEEDLRDRQRELKLVTTETFQGFPTSSTEDELLVGLSKDSNPLSNHQNSLSLLSTSSRKEGIGWKIMRLLGWDGNMTITSPAAQLLEKANKNPLKIFGNNLKAPKSSGIGLGILEDEDEDEDGDMNGFSRGGGRKEEWKEEVEEGGANEKRLPTFYGRTLEEADNYGERSNFEKKDLKFKKPLKDHDCIEGFTISTLKCTPSVIQFKYDNEPAAVVPKDFIPKGLYGKSDETITPKVMDKSLRLSVKERGRILLGEENNVLEADAAADCESVARVPSEETLKTDHYYFDKDGTTLDVQTALLAQRGFMPFTFNVEKDNRYRQFLGHFASPQTVELPRRPQEMSLSEFKREQVEFVKAANIYRPLPGIMAAKFTSSKKGNVLEQSIPPKGGLYRPDPKPPSKKEPIVDDGTPSSTGPIITNPPFIVKEEKKTAIPYGKDTRKELSWSPSSLLCKYFGIEQPAAARCDESIKEASPNVVKPVLSLKSVQKIVLESSYADKVDLTALEGGGEGEGPDKERENTIKVEPLEEPDRPAMELFKSIFCDSSSEGELDDKDRDKDGDGDGDEFKEEKGDSQLPSLDEGKRGIPEPLSLSSPSIICDSPSSSRGKEIVDRPSLHYKGQGFDISTSSKSTSFKTKKGISRFPRVSCIEEPMVVKVDKNNPLPLAKESRKISKVKSSSLSISLMEEDREEGKESASTASAAAADIVTIRKQRPAASDLW